jgi:putative Mg2+ transporter-C (MgtC) family protein
MVNMIEWSDTVVRLGAALVIGGVIGLDRNLHHKPTGVRTLGLVALGAALAVLAVAQGSPADTSRVIQGVITGVGFLGAGVILHRPTGKRVHGLTTAAAIWVTATLGMLCGLAAWRPVVIAIAFVLLLLFFGGPFEKWCHRQVGSEDDTISPEPKSDEI